MASLIYNSCIDDMARGAIDFDTDTFKVMLVTSTYTANDKVTLSFAAVSWSTATITARGAVYYKSRGGASSADELVAYVDFGGDVSSTGATFTLGSSVITLQN